MRGTVVDFMSGTQRSAHKVYQVTIDSNAGTLALKFPLSASNVA